MKTTTTSFSLKKSDEVFILIIAVVSIGLSIGGMVYGLGAKPGIKTELLNGQWSYMPGTTKNGSSLGINDLDFKIVEQDGSGGQPNPPVNLYGTHLKAEGPFEIDAQMRGIEGRALLELAGKVPNIQDEFRVVPPGLQLEVEPAKKQITAEVWVGKSQPNLANPQPAVQKIYKYDGDRNISLNISRSGGKLILGLNNRKLGTLPEKKVFESGQVWFGADSHGGSWRLASLMAQNLNSGRIQVEDSSGLSVQTDKDSLQQIASQIRPGFKVGAAMALAPMVGDDQYRNVALGGNFGAMTIENASKWQFTEPKAGQYDFSEADALVDFAHRHNMVVNGHAIVFSEALPQWVHNLPTKTPVQKAFVRKVFLEHVSTEAIHFKGKVASWDIDEVFADYDQFNSSNGQIFRKNVWLGAMGPDYIAQAIQKIHSADPDALIRINDYGLEANGQRWDAVSKYLVHQLTTQLRQMGVPTNKIMVGFESHVYERRDKINPSVLTSHMDRLAQYGIKSAITEIDVYSDNGIAAQSNQYSGVFKACFTNPNCLSFTTWGISDRYDLWQDENHKLHFGQDFLWDKNMNPTEAQQAIASYLKKSPGKH